MHEIHGSQQRGDQRRQRRQPRAPRSTARAGALRAPCAALQALPARAVWSAGLRRVICITYKI